jgi:multiple sugar transport system substrate-binding protein
LTFLRGITWDHPRGAGGLEATASVYNQSHPGTQVTWETRSLLRFGEQGLAELAESFDLLVIDHPFVGFAANAGCLLPLDAVLPASFLELQHEQSTGPSHRSYEYAGHQWALAVDAAAQFSAYRPDLMESPPGDWDSVLEFAQREGARVAIPLVPTDAFASFLTLCANGGEPPFVRDDVIVPRDAGLRALSLLQRLAELMNPGSFALNPPGLLELMSSTDQLVYAPLLFGYSNYSRPGFRPNLVRFADIPSSGDGPAGSLLGGAGIAISSRCADVKAAADYAMWVCQPEVQRGLYFESGGQPGNRVAWLDEGVNGNSDGFFKRTLATLSRAYLRPRYDGYVAVQTACGKIIHEGLVNRRDPEIVYSELNAAYSGTRGDSGT